MSKKIISAILVMAMIVSMSATALLSSVGAAAETDYEADRATLKSLIQELVIYGPKLEDDTYTLLKQTGILTWNNDKGYYNELNARTNFWNKFAGDVNDYLFTSDANAKEITKNANEAVKYAASAYYFGQDANNEVVDATFNAGRNAVVKSGISKVNAIFTSLRGQVGAEVKPSAYDNYFNGEDYKGFATASKAYNQSIGFNPYLYIITKETDDNYYDDTYWGNSLGQYTVRWYTFAEAREIDADGVFAFENAIRTIALNNGEGVLFHEFIENDVTPFKTIVNDLFSNLVGTIDNYFVDGVDVDDQIKEYLKLNIIISYYDLYIKDVYNNIYTASSAQLLNDVLYAKRLIDYIDGTNSKLLVLALSDFSELTDDILAGIKAVSPRSEQLLTSEEIATATALVKKANALLTQWSNWASIDSLKGTWGNLKAATNNLANMLPVSEGESVTIIVAEGTKGMKNIHDNDVVNDTFLIEFTPNYFAYVKFVAQLEAQIAHFTNVLNSGSISDRDLGNDNNIKTLVNTINSYAYLVGVVGNLVTVDDKGVVSAVEVDKTSGQWTATKIYQELLYERSFEQQIVVNDGMTYLEILEHFTSSYKAASTAGVYDKKSIYETVLGYVFGDNEYRTDVNQDAAIDNVVSFIKTVVSASKYALAGNYGSTGTFDWTSGSWSYTNGISKQVETLVNALKGLTKDITVEVQTYAWILDNVAKVFGWEYKTDSDVSKRAYATTDTGKCEQLVTSFPGYGTDASPYYMNKALSAANALSGLLTGKTATYASLKSAYDSFIDAVKTYLLTDEGAAELDKFVEDVYYVADAYLEKNPTAWNDYDMLLQKLQNSNCLSEYYKDAKNCYQYFAVTLKHAAECDNHFTNIYNAKNGALEANLVAPLKSYLGTIDVSGYTRDWAENFDEVRQLAAYIVASISYETTKVNETTVTTFKAVNSDMPVWYAERVLSETAAAWADRNNNTVAALVEYKAGLEALLIEADGLNVYNFVTNNDEAKAIWTAFVDAYTNAQYVALDGRCPKSDVDDAVAALTAAMEDLTKIEAPEGAATADTLAAKIEAAEAVYARADVTDSSNKEALELAIAKAKKALQFNITVLNSTDIQAEVDALNNAMKALTNDMYIGKDLKKDTKVLELQVVADLYTEASYRKFANAVEAAYTMAEEDTASESEMMAAYASVEERFGDLKLAPVEDKPAEEEPTTSVVMEQAVIIYNEAANGYAAAVEGCTAETAAAYNAAINTLKADIANGADDAKLLESIIALNLAKAGLTVEVPDTCND